MFACSSCIPVPLLFLKRIPCTPPEPVQPEVAEVTKLEGDCGLTLFAKLGEPVGFWSDRFPCLCHPVISCLYSARGGFTAFFSFRPSASYFLPVAGKISWRVVMTTFVCILCQRPEEIGQTFTCINVFECALVKACLRACEHRLRPGPSA